MVYGREVVDNLSQPSKFEEAYTLFDKDLDIISKELFIWKAA